MNETASVFHHRFLSILFSSFASPVDTRLFHLVCHLPYFGFVCFSSLCNLCARPISVCQSCLSSCSFVLSAWLLFVPSIDACMSLLTYWLDSFGPSLLPCPRARPQSASSFPSHSILFFLRLAHLSTSWCCCSAGAMRVWLFLRRPTCGLPLCGLHAVFSFSRIIYTPPPPVLHLFSVLFSFDAFVPSHRSVY